MRRPEYLFLKPIKVKETEVCEKEPREEEKRACEAKTCEEKAVEEKAEACEEEKEACGEADTEEKELDAENSLVESSETDSSLESSLVSEPSISSPTEQSDNKTFEVDDYFTDDFYDSYEIENIQKQLDNSSSEEEVCTEEETKDLFSDDLYTSTEKEKTASSFSKPVVSKNTDGLKEYSFASSYRVTRKEALTSIEAKSPFVVMKIMDKKAKISEDDGVYRTIPKIKHSDRKKALRIGYVEVTKKPTLSNMNPLSSIVKGIVNDEYLITSKRKFNTKKIGYIKITPSIPTEIESLTEEYVEVRESRGVTPFLTAALLTALIVTLLPSGLDKLKENNWHFNPSNLRIYKTESTIDYTESTVTIYHSANPILKDNILPINITSEKKDGLSYEVEIKEGLTGNTLYKSEKIESGDGIAEIEISSENLSLAEDINSEDCLLECKTYRGNKYIGSVESTFTLRKE